MGGISGTCLLLLPRRRGFHSLCHGLITAPSHAYLLGGPLVWTQKSTQLQRVSFLLPAVNEEAEWLFTVFSNKGSAVCSSSLFFFCCKNKREHIYVGPCFALDTASDLLRTLLLLILPFQDAGTALISLFAERRLHAQSLGRLLQVRHLASDRASSSDPGRFSRSHTRTHVHGSVMRVSIFTRA